MDGLNVDVDQCLEAETVAVGAAAGLGGAVGVQAALHVGLGDVTGADDGARPVAHLTHVAFMSHYNA